MPIIQTKCLELINPENNNYKFYNLSLTDDAVIIIRYGRIGTNGRVIEKSYSTQSEAELEFAKTTTKKMVKGYKSNNEAAELPENQETMNSKNKNLFLEEFPPMI